MRYKVQQLCLGKTEVNFTMFDFILKKNKKNALDSMQDSPSGVFHKLVFYSSLFAVLLAIIETGFDFKVWLHGVASTFYLIVLGLNFIEL